MIHYFASNEVFGITVEKNIENILSKIDATINCNCT